MPPGRLFVKVLVGAALCLALLTSALLPAPADLPAVALEQPSLYRLEIAMAFFYGSLLLATPAYSGLAMGRLPIEISTRGAKFATEADQAVARDGATTKQLEQGVADLKAKLAAIKVEVDRLRQQP